MESKPIPGASRYIANSDGTVFSTAKSKKGKLLKPSRCSSRSSSNYYTRVEICKDDGTYEKVMLHRLIATVFVPNPDNKPCVNHINGIKSDNRVENLEWCTYSENTQHAKENNLLNPPKGTRNAFSVLSETEAKDVVYLIKQGKTNKEIAESMEIKTRQVSSIRNKKNWKYVWEEMYPGEDIIKNGDGRFKSKYSLEQQVEILKDIKDNVSNKDIIEKHGVPYFVIHHVKTRESAWKEAKDIVNENNN